MTTKEKAFAALEKAQTSQSLTNYPTIFKGFAAMGIPETEIKPRENIFTFYAWKALGRSIRKGQHGIKVVTFKDCSKKKHDEKTGEEKVESYSIPWSTTVFHISQTEKLKEAA